MSQLDQLEPKDPNEEKDYKARWGRYLGVDTIASSSWIIPDGITKFNESFDAQSATVWLSGGTLGADYLLVNQIVTNSSPPLKLDQTITIRVRSR